MLHCQDTWPGSLKWLQDVSLVCSGFKFNLPFPKICNGAMFGDIPLSLQMPSAVLTSTTTWSVKPTVV